jgi:G3E family GTPase
LIAKESGQGNHAHVSQDHIQTFQIIEEGICAADAVERTLSALPDNVLRVKGFIQTDDGPFLVNKVGKRITLSACDGSLRIGKNIFVCIGFGIAENEDGIRAAFADIPFR